MKATDYSKIASWYDKNKLRHDVPRDENIERLYAIKQLHLNVLDLACGTGNYLKKQIEEYVDFSIAWTGIDKSPEMLEIATQKDIRARLIVGDACQIPLQDKSVDYIKIRFAFPAFKDSTQHLKRIRAG